MNPRSALTHPVHSNVRVRGDSQSKEKIAKVRVLNRFFKKIKFKRIYSHSS